MRTLCIFCLCLWGTVMNASADSNIKRMNVAGQFYKAQPEQLSQEIQSYLKKADPGPSDHDVKIVIAPHAGYVYSGQAAARVYAQTRSSEYSTVVVLAPSHYVGFSGISVWTAGGFETPLGVVDVDSDFARQLAGRHPDFVEDRAAFDREHALEVQLPFIQLTHPRAKIVSVIMGQGSFETCGRVAEALADIIGTRDDVLVVVSSDMSHFHDAATARAMDETALAVIQKGAARELWQRCAARELEMCGFVPTVTAMLLAERLGLSPRVIGYTHSGEVTGDDQRVVGYGSVVFERQKKIGENAAESVQPGGALSPAQHERLIAIARQTIEAFVRHGETLEVKEDDPRLQEHEGAFVTLHRQGHLRGCIGHIIGQQPLYLTVRDMAIQAAAHDPRFPPVSAAELEDIDLEISVLSTPRRVQRVEEITMGVHGVIVSRGLMHRGVFLPQVATETGWSRDEFLSQLCAQKAGLSPDAWKDPSTVLEIFTADVFSEKDIKGP